MEKEYTLDQLSNMILYETIEKDESLNWRVFSYHIYEYRKGLRSLVLHTSPNQYQEKIKNRLEKENIEYLIYKTKTNINTFFGDHEFIEVIKNIGKDDLKKYSPQEDFMLGILLGYSRKEQCKRYLSRI